MFPAAEKSVGVAPERSSLPEALEDVAEESDALHRHHFISPKWKVTKRCEREVADARACRTRLLF